ncbi:PilZ domain-containing protein [Pseudodesulfovibrio thermohalotolerans]|uniref:PilZ domain-containing protein n=1 Tax=Pseudodesulfovibrio thermohalotolerans TaxID=2880651 RepID=UPI002443289F|nr:PilZ domain-containing protein [Pseudodesulfovibrio thermohalotolerans]WFS62780.1 PilZ domain-containing protein [Pseudodesulfovibrio thermohalotolerans]
MDSNKRRNTRIDAGFEAYITVGDVVTPVSTRNLSLKGALLDGCGDCAEGTACELHLPLSPGIRIVVSGKIVRAKGDSAAMSFREMDELSFTFLHRLVTLNAERPEKVDEELLRVFERL